MAESKGNTAVPQGDHDRVVMLSLHPDGSPAQHDPEVIGPKDVAVEAAKRQFAEQAVSAVDVEKRGVATGGAAVTLVGQEDGSVKEEPARGEADPSVTPLVEAHQSARKAAESAAESTVKSLHKGLGDPGSDTTGTGTDNPARPRGR